MKPRMVMVTIEVETDAQLSEIGNREYWACAIEGTALNQVHAQVVKPKPKKKAKKRRKTARARE